MVRAARISCLGSLLFLLAILLGSPMAHAQNVTKLHDFNCATEGCYPLYPDVLVQGRDGNLYGTTYEGGPNSCDVNAHTCGTFFMFNVTTGALTTLFSFDKVAHGGKPQGGLTLALDGNFYGTTSVGGANGLGNVFRITPAGMITVLHDFSASEGSAVWAAPVLGKDGNLYGTIGLNAANSNGAAYKITVSSGAYKLLTQAVPGYAYSALHLGLDGSLYVTTYNGGTNKKGALYSMSSTGATKLIYSLNGTTGSNPYDTVTQDAAGIFYFNAQGSANNAGSVLKVTSRGVATDLHDFGAFVGDGSNPYDALVTASDGNLYGVTNSGGGHGDGTLFEIADSTGIYSSLYSFDGFAHGADPVSDPVQHSNGLIYGMTRVGGSNGMGVLFSVDNSLPKYARLMTFWGSAGGTVQILGTGLTGTTAVDFGTGASTSVNVVSDTYLTAVVPADGVTGTVTVKTPGGTLTGQRPFHVIPVVSSFSPAGGNAGITVTITGTGFVGTTNVTVGGVKATNVVADPSGKSITATVPTGVKTGKIAVTTAGGTATSSKNFYVTPTVSSFNPTSGSIGTSVTITGTNFTGATSVTFNGVSTTPFTVNSATQITAKVPSGATTGPIAVTNPGGTGTSSTNFTVH